MVHIFSLLYLFITSTYQSSESEPDEDNGRAESLSFNETLSFSQELEELSVSVKYNIGQEQQQQLTGSLRVKRPRRIIKTSSKLLLLLLTYVIFN